MNRSSRCLIGALAVSLSLHFAQTACAARIYVGLRGRNEPALRALLAAQQDPTASEYHRWIGAQEFGRRFGAAPRDLKRVERWLRSGGMPHQASRRPPAGPVCRRSARRAAVGARAAGRRRDRPRPARAPPASSRQLQVAAPERPSERRVLLHASGVRRLLRVRDPALRRHRRLRPAHRHRRDGGRRVLRHRTRSAACTACRRSISSRSERRGTTSRATISSRRCWTSPGRARWHPVRR